MVIETGHAIQRFAPSKILASLLKDHGNPVVQSQIDQLHLGQLTKAPGGNIRVKVQTNEFCQCLAGQKKEGRYRFGGFDTFADRFFIDVSSVGSDSDDGTFRDVNSNAVTTTNI